MASSPSAQASDDAALALLGDRLNVSSTLD